MPTASGKPERRHADVGDCAPREPHGHRAPELTSAIGGRTVRDLVHHLPCGHPMHRRFERDFEPPRTVTVYDAARLADGALGHAADRCRGGFVFDARPPSTRDAWNPSRDETGGLAAGVGAIYLEVASALRIPERLLAGRPGGWALAVVRRLELGGRDRGCVVIAESAEAARTTARALSLQGGRSLAVTLD